MLITSLNKNGALRIGTKGTAAKLIQTCLKNAGYDLGKWGVDGSWGAATDKAFRKFQKDHKLKVDGLAGNNTLYELMFYFYPNFRKSEFRCKCGKYCNGYPVRVDENLLVLLEKIRKAIGNKPISINSGLRCKTHNKNVGGSPNSQHLKGTAVDIKSSVGVTKLWSVSNQLNPKGGVGRYNTHVHVDTRGHRSRWDYR